MSLGVFGTVLWHGLEYRHGVPTQDVELKDKRRVEHHVCLLLEREYPFVFASANAPPHTDSVPSRIGTEFGVADDTSEQTIVGGRYPVVVVERNGGKSRYVYLENLRRVDTLRYFGVQGVNALDYEYRVAVEFYRVAIVSAASGSEVEGRYFYSFALQYSAEVVSEELEVESVERFVVGLALVVNGSVFSIDEIIIHRKRKRFYSRSHQLYCQPFGECSLTRRRRTRYQHRLLAFGYDTVGYLCYLFFVQSLSHLNEVFENFGIYRPIEVARIDDTEQCVPTSKFIEYSEQLRLLFEGSYMVGAVSVGYAKEHPVFVAYDIEQIQISRRGNKYRQIIVVKPAERIVRYERFAHTVDKIDRIHIALTLENRDSLFFRRLVNFDRHIGFDDLAYTLPYTLYFIVSNLIFASVDIAIISMRNRMLHPQNIVGIKLSNSLRQYHSKTTNVCTITRRRRGIEKLHYLRTKYLKR